MMTDGEIEAYVPVSSLEKKLLEEVKRLRAEICAVRTDADLAKVFLRYDGDTCPVSVELLGVWAARKEPRYASDSDLDRRMHAWLHRENERRKAEHEALALRIAELETRRDGIFAAKGHR